MALSEIVLSIFGGGATGIIGAAISRYSDYKTKQLDNAHSQIMKENEIQMKNLDIKVIELEWAGRNSIATIEADARMDVADSQAFNTALNSEPKIYANSSKFTKAQNTIMVILDFIRGVIRPGLTLYLCAITTAVYLQAGTIIKDQPITIQHAVDIYIQISSTILYLTTTVVLFYFGSRPKKEKQ